MSELITVDSSNVISPGTSVVTVKDMIKIRVDGHLVASMDGKFDFGEIDPEYHQYAINLINGMGRDLYTYSESRVAEPPEKEVKEPIEKHSLWNKLVSVFK